MSDLREQIRVGTLRRMREALADVDARLEGLHADRARLAASIAEVGVPEAGESPRPAGHAADDREPLLPVTSPRVERALKAIMRDVGFSPEQIATRFPDRTEDATPEPAVLAVVTLSADGRLVVSAPGTPTTRIVAIREKRARAAAQRVAELVEEALQARDRESGFSKQI